MTSEFGRLSKQIIRLKHILIHLKAVLDMMIILVVWLIPCKTFETVIAKKVTVWFKKLDTTNLFAENPKLCVNLKAVLNSRMIEMVDTANRKASPNSCFRALLLVPKLLEHPAESPTPSQRNSTSTHHRPVYIPKRSFLAVENFPFYLVSLLVNSVNVIRRLKETVLVIWNIRGFQYLIYPLLPLKAHTHTHTELSSSKELTLLVLQLA